MGKYKEFSIKFDQDKEKYFAGEQLSGNVILHLNEPTNILRIALQVKGKAVCKSGHSCNELIYKNDIILFGAKPGSPAVNHEHPSGRKLYRFNVMLPVELPSTAVEGGGFIKYCLTARVTFKAILTSDWQIKKPFEVKQILDANVPNYDLQHVHNAKKIPTIFQNQKKLEKEDILVSLERGVYCPGEEVKLHLQYKYVVARKLGLVKCRLNKYGQFNKKDNKSVYKKTIVEQSDNKRHDDKIIQRIISIKIPEGVAPTNTLTNAVVINYVIHVKMEGYREVKLPFIIGTIPYNETEAQQQLTRSNKAGMTETQAQAPSAPPSAQPSAPPSAPLPDEMQATASFSATTSDVYPSLDNFDRGAEIQCEFFHPPPYVPQDEFDLPPSYDDAMQESTQSNSPQLVVAQ